MTLVPLGADLIHQRAVTYIINFTVYLGFEPHPGKLSHFSDTAFINMSLVSRHNRFTDRMAGITFGCSGNIYELIPRNMRRMDRVYRKAPLCESSSLIKNYCIYIGKGLQIIGALN